MKQSKNPVAIVKINQWSQEKTVLSLHVYDTKDLMEWADLGMLFWSFRPATENIKDPNTVRYEAQQESKCPQINSQFALPDVSCPALLQVSLFLRDSWITTLRAHIRTSLRDAGKGWFNIYDKNWEGYQQSKLKKLMNYIKYNMEVFNFTNSGQTMT